MYTGTSNIPDFSDTYGGKFEDQCSLYESSSHSASTIADFVAWDSDSSHDSDWESDDTNAEDAPWGDLYGYTDGIWTDNAYVDTSGIASGGSICLTTDGIESNNVNNWHVYTSAGHTQGGENIPEFSTTIIPIFCIVALFSIIRKRKREKTT